jgi:hypothetical protein
MSFFWRSYASFGTLIQATNVYREFSKRHLVVPYKVHGLISARLKIEKREQQSAATDQSTEDRCRYKGGFFKRLYRGHFSSGAPQ